MTPEHFVILGLLLLLLVTRGKYVRQRQRNARLVDEIMRLEARTLVGGGRTKRYVTRIGGSSE